MTITNYEEWLTQVDQESEKVSVDKNTHYLLVKEGYDKFDGGKSAQITWRMGRAVYKLAAVAEVAKDKSNQRKYLSEAEEWEKKALELDANCPQAHLWLASIGGKMCDLLPTKERIAKAKEIRHHLEESLKLQKDDFIAYYTYGRWCLEVAGLSWMERKIAAVIFDSPPEASYQDAMDKFTKVYDLKPGWKANLFWMSKTAIAMKNYSMAIKWADEATKAEANDEEDLTVLTDLEGIVKKYSSYRK